MIVNLSLDPPPNVLTTRRMEPKRRNRDRQWKHRTKVSSNLSKDFPWEVVLRSVKGHARSMILLQMVDKNLRNLIQTDHVFWLQLYKKEMASYAYAVRSVIDPLYPDFKLWKNSITSMPVYTGPLRGDHDDHKLPPGFDATFSSYVRRVYALKHGTRCGVCGCRYRHEPYWSLRMRVCRLCMEGNTVSGDMLCRKYGVDYSDVIAQYHGKIFYYKCRTLFSDDRVSMHCMHERDITHTNSTCYLFWLPHLRQFLDLPSLYKTQIERKKAASLLSGIIQRRWIQEQQHVFCTRKSSYSIDCLMVMLYRNDKKRVAQRYGSRIFCGGIEWKFPEYPRNGVSKVMMRNGMCNTRYYHVLVEFEDWVV